MNGDFIYYHNPKEVVHATYSSTYCVEQDPCDNFNRYTGQLRSPWSKTVISPGDNAGLIDLFLNADHTVPIVFS